MPREFVIVKEDDDLRTKPFPVQEGTEVEDLPLKRFVYGKASHSAHISQVEKRIAQFAGQFTIITAGVAIP